MNFTDAVTVAGTRRRPAAAMAERIKTGPSANAK